MKIGTKMVNIKGTIISSKIYQKTCKPEHFMKMFKGFGISVKILAQLEHQFVKYVRIVYEGKKCTNVYLCRLDKFMESDKTWLNEGTDLQKFVSVSDMYKEL